MLRIFPLLLIISYMGFIDVYSREENPLIEESFFDTVHQLVEENDFFQAQEVLVRMISQDLFVAENFDYGGFQSIKQQIFKRLIEDYETIPTVLHQLFERVSWKDVQKEFAIYRERIQKQVENFFASATHDSFYQLPLLEEDKKNIRIIIKTMAEKGLVKLLFERHYLEKKGDQVNYIHPLRFIGYIFSDMKLKNCMRQIKTSRFKWNEFVNGFSRRMNEEYAIDNLRCYIPEFIEQVHPKHPERIEAFITRKAWEDLVADLLH